MRGAKSASVDRCCAAVGVVARERERAGGVLREVAGAADDAREGLVTGAVVDEVPAVCDGSRVAAASEAARAGDRQRAGADRGRAGVGVGCGERECAVALLYQR